MSKKTIVIPAVLLALVILVVYAIEMDPHNFDRSKCNTCHVLDSAGNVMGRELTAAETVLCMRCHSRIFSDGYMHPVNVKPRRVAVPDDMHLSQYGDLTCSSCHDIHSTYFTAYGSRSYYLRRGETGRDFCIICHRESDSLSGGHKAVLGEAHFKARYIAIDYSQEIDPISKDCVSCHDGSYATSVSIRAGYWSHGSELMRNDMGIHPIGVDYESARLRSGRKSDLRPMDMIDRRIRFFNGKIGCGSCHDPYSTIEKQLVMSDVNSKLCFSCHLMEGRV